MRGLLMVDTCGKEGGVAVADLSRTRDTPIVAERTLPGRETQEHLMLAVAAVLHESGLRTLHDIDSFVVVSGPGSFTGVRIGMAAVKGLAEATSKPVAAVSRLAMLAGEAPGRGTTHAWLDAGRGDIYAGTYRDGLRLSESMLHRDGARNSVRDGDRVLIAETALSDAHPRAEIVPMPGFLQALHVASAQIAAGAFADVATLDANYLRVPDAELALDARERQPA